MKGTKALSFAVDWTRLRAKSGQSGTLDRWGGEVVRGGEELLKEIEREGEWKYFGGRKRM